MQPSGAETAGGSGVDLVRFESLSALSEDMQRRVLSRNYEVCVCVRACVCKWMCVWMFVCGDVGLFASSPNHHDTPLSPPHFALTTRVVSVAPSQLQALIAMSPLSADVRSIPG